MDLLTFSVAITGIAALLAQAVFSFWMPLSGAAPGAAPDDPGGRREIGMLNLFLAAAASVAAISMRYGTMVLAPQFGALMVQGQRDVWLLRVTLVALAFLPALCWHRIRMINGWKSILWPSLGVAAVVGTWAAFQVNLINPTEVQALHIYSYDVWWPPMVAWFAVCGAGCVHSLLVLKLDSECSMFASALIAGLAVFATRLEDLPDNPGLPWWLQSRFLWITLKHVACGFSALALIYEFVPAAGGTGWKEILGRMRKVEFVLASTITLIVMFVPAVLAWALPLMVPAYLGRIELIPPVIVGLLAVTAIVAGVSNGDQWKGLLSHLGRTVPKDDNLNRMIRILIGLAVPIIGYCLIDIFSWGFWPMWAAMAALFFFWILLVEALAGGVLDTLPITRPKLKAALGVGREWIVWIFKKSRENGGWVIAKLSGTNNWVKAVLAVVSPLVVLSLIIVANELQNYQSIVVHPLDWTGPGDDVKDGPEKDLGKVLSNGLINELGLLKKDLRAELMAAQRMAQNESGRITRPLSATPSDTYVETAVAKSDDVTIAGVKIPLGFFIRPIQTLVDGFLRIRTVGGSVRKTGSLYVVLLNSSDGGSWKEKIETAPPPAPAGAVAPPQCPAIPTGYIDPVDDLIQTLAFDVASTDPAFVSSGMTKNRDAFRAFRTGVYYFGKVDLEQDPAAAAIDLSQAIECFNESEKHDRSFAPAEYRLGIALQREWQPSGAVSQFRASLQASPGFIPAALQQAQTQYDFAAYWFRQTALVPHFQAPPGFRWHAIDLWTEILDLPSVEITPAERRNAYAGICQFELETRRMVAGPLPSYVPFYFCSRAHNLYFRLPKSAGQDDDERSKEGVLLDSIAVSLESHRDPGLTQASKAGDPWYCLGWPVNLAQSGQPARRVSAALRYYRAAAAFMPDDASLQCNIASAAARLGDMNEMRRLDHESGAHLLLANNLSADANAAVYRPDSSPAPPDQAVALFQRALAEYSTAIDEDRSRIEALNAYAYTAWEWEANWLQYWNQNPATQPPPAALAYAEFCARSALALAIAHRGVEDQWSARSTLGEVLFAAGRNAEAIDEFQKIIDNVWVGQTEVRWDMIGAKVCAARETKTGAAQLYRDATTLLQQIENSSQRPELPSLWTPRNVWDRIVGLECPISPASHQVPAPYKLDKKMYSSSQWCDWGMLSADVYEGNRRGDGLLLHAWGDGVDEVHPAGGDPILLENPAASRPGRYFAQLLFPGNLAASDIISFDTKKACSEGQLKLVFRKSEVKANGNRSGLSARR